MNRWLRPALLLFLILNLFAVPPLLAQDEATPTPPPEATSEPLVPKIHVVASGETLTTIAALYDVTIEEIMFLNNLSNADAIYEGQELVIPGAEGDRIPAFYTVQVGERLADVAQRYNTDVEAIVALNSLVSSQLVAGQRIGLLSGSGSTEPLPLTGRFHVVTLDETLLSVSMIYGLQPAELAAANHLAEPAVVFPGQRL
ncbi:MAG: LysM peptidoglycan-binding domain-containing protein, partial [Anaerolineales bacterium]|nr:LysM peptidoglycan-binding domain-containing protein [Anaerolineales bacterium]